MRFRRRVWDPAPQRHFFICFDGDASLVSVLEVDYFEKEPKRDKVKRYK